MNLQLDWPVFSTIAETIAQACNAEARSAVIAALNTCLGLPIDVTDGAICECSAGERHIAEIALLVVRASQDMSRSVLVIDEFCSILDRSRAALVCRGKPL